jgi:DNA-binding transcriptional LysR family regulator
MITFSKFSDYFVAVAKSGSFRQAAEQLYISVSAVHRQIALAEEQLAVQLFERLPQGLKLTLAGELLYADILKWQKEFQQTCVRFDEIHGLRRGSIDIGLISALGDGLMIEAIAQMQQQYPWINIKLQVLDSAQVIHQLVNNDLDFGLLLNPKIQANLEVSAFVEIPIGYVCAAAHPLATARTLRFSDTLEQTHLLAAEPLIIHDYVSAIYKKHHFSPAKQIQCNDIRMLCALLKQNLGIAILSYLDVYPLLQSQQLVFRQLDQSTFHPLTLALCVAPKRQLSRAAQMMIKQLTQLLEQFKQQLSTVIAAP